MVKKKKKKQFNQESRDDTVVKRLAFNQSGLGWILDSVFWKSSNIGNISFHLVMQHCYSASCKAWLPIITTPPSNLLRNKFQCCKLQQHSAQKRTQLAGVIIQATKQLAKQQCCTTSCKEMLPVLLDLKWLEFIVSPRLAPGIFFRIL